MKNTTSNEQQSPSRPDYSVYNMKLVDRVTAFFIGFIIAFIVMQVFFGYILVSAITGVGAGIFAQKPYRIMMIKRQQNEMLTNFKDFLDLLNASVSSGMTTMSAFADCETRLVNQYGDNNNFCSELRWVNYIASMEGGVENAFSDFASRSHCKDIENFARILSLAKQQGGNVRNIIRDAKNTISDKIDITREIETSISSTRNQLYIMMVLPIIVIPLTSSLIENDGSPAMTIITKLVAIALFVIAFVMGRKITDIKI